MSGTDSKPRTMRERLESTPIPEAVEALTHARATIVERLAALCGSQADLQGALTAVQAGDYKALDAEMKPLRHVDDRPEDAIECWGAIGRINDTLQRVLDGDDTPWEGVNVAAVELKRTDLDFTVSPLDRAIRRADFAEAVISGTKRWPTPTRQCELGNPTAAGILAETDGWLRDFILHVVATSRWPQPFLALGAGLAALGAAAGRRYASRTNIRTNMFVLGVADSGSGKEDPRRAGPDMLRAAGLKQYVGASKLASDAALLGSLTRYPVRFYSFDEIGHWFASNQDRNAARHQKDIVPRMTELWSRAAGVYDGTDYADPKEKPREIIIQPHLCVYGTTVPDTLYKNLDTSMVSDGHIPRWLLFRSPQDTPKPNKGMVVMPPPEHLLETLRLISGFVGGDGNLAGAGPEPMTSDEPIDPYVVDQSDAATALIDEMTDDEWELKDRHTGKLERPFYSRRSEYTIKVALVRAISRDPVAPRIEVTDVRWARDVVDLSLRTWFHALENYISDGVWDGQVKKVLDCIRKAGLITATALGEAPGVRAIDRRRRGDILDDLQERGRIEEVLVKKPGGKKPAKAYRLTQEGAE